MSPAANTLWNGRIQLKPASVLLPVHGAVNLDLLLPN